MKNKTYYGEYTLKHWIDLILKQNIVLPDYQRSLAWDEEKIKFFIKSLKNDEFIPPIAIGKYKKNKNLILDGQQRLTSIFLAYFKCYPKKAKKMKNLSDEAKDTEEDNNENKIYRDWTFKELVNQVKDVSDKENKIKSLLQNQLSGYEKLVLDDIDEKFFENKFLGFSYIVPKEDSPDKNYVDKLFSTIFRNINYQGISLTRQESRKSLYYTNTNFINFFEGKFKDTNNEIQNVLCDLELQEHNQKTSEIDFVRYLAILSQYNLMDKEPNKIMTYYSSLREREKYYVDFISKIVGIEQNETRQNFENLEFDKMFGNWQERYRSLHEILKNIKWKIFNDKKQKYFTSWIDADYWLFGLLHYVIFENKLLKDNIDNLINEIKKEIEFVKNSKDELDKNGYNKYTRTPNTLSNTRDRLKKSIEIYGKYINE